VAAIDGPIGATWPQASGSAARTRDTRAFGDKQNFMEEGSCAALSGRPELSTGFQSGDDGLA